MKPDAVKRFWEKVHKTKGCWNWTASTVSFGYGSAWDGSRLWYAHRLSWTMKNGNIPTNLYVLHKCDNPACVRPSHLYLGKKKQNALDRKERNRHWKNRAPLSFQSHMKKIAPHKGEENGYAKFTTQDVLKIRSSKKTIKQLAADLNVSFSAIWRIKTKRSWSHV